MTSKTWGCTAELTWLVRTLVFSTVQCARYILITTKKKKIELSSLYPIPQPFDEFFLWKWTKLKFKNMSSTSTSEATEAANTLDRRSSQASSNGDAASLDDYIVKGKWNFHPYFALRIQQPILKRRIRIFANFLNNLDKFGQVLQVLTNVCLFFVGNNLIGWKFRIGSFGIDCLICWAK